MAEVSNNLRNEDFRKLLAETPRRSDVSQTPARDSGSAHSFKHRPPVKVEKKKGGHGHKHKKERTEEAEDDANLKELLKKYRDRAAERRTKGTDDASEADKLTAAYRAVPGDARAVTDKANLRKQAIEESKFLGGDMEHTHLVKGLDYSLLHKVRSEIVKSQNETDVGDDLEAAYTQSGGTAPTEVQTENMMVRNIHTLLFKNEPPVRNELFGKGRMAYVVEMEEDESDIPTTLLRSIQDCPVAESNANINANNMLISKLTQVLSYLRTDHKKKKRHDLGDGDHKKHQNDNIYENEAEYVPKKERDRRDGRNRDRDRKKDRDYFDSKDRDRRDRGDRDRRDRDRERDRRGRDYDRVGDRRDIERTREREKEEREREKERKAREEQEREKKLEEKMEKRKKATEDVGYGECYPGGFAEMGGAWDSDEEDFSKMDQGSKKPIIKRWDFENQEEYESYQGGREAMPKAAYQFGLKPADGRKTRKSMDVNKKIDKELNQINQINEKRKAGGDREDYKRPKY